MPKEVLRKVVEKTSEQVELEGITTWNNLTRFCIQNDWSLKIKWESSWGPHGLPPFYGWKATIRRGFLRSRRFYLNHYRVEKDLTLDDFAQRIVFELQLKKKNTDIKELI